jgi:glycine hydroxymethyltransferase
MTGESLLSKTYATKNPNKVVMTILLDGYAFGDPDNPLNAVEQARRRGMTPTLDWLRKAFQSAVIPTSGYTAGLRGGDEKHYPAGKVKTRDEAIAFLQERRDRRPQVEVVEVYNDFATGSPVKRQSPETPVWRGYDEALRELEQSPFFNDRWFVVEDDPARNVVGVIYGDLQQIGSTEFNTAVIGDGRIIPQDVSRVDEAIRSGEFFQSPGYQLALRKFEEQGYAHLVGTLQESVLGVHASLRHLYHEVAYLKSQGITTFVFDLALDGRDEGKFDSEKRLQELMAAMAYFGITDYYINTFTRDLFDRAQKWDKTREILNLLFLGRSRAEEAASLGGKKPAPPSSPERPNFIIGETGTLAEVPENASSLGAAAPGVQQGLLFDPGYAISKREGIDYSTNYVAPELRRAEETLALLRRAEELGVALEIEAHLRGVDGAGSSMDLPEFQLKLTKPGAKALREITSTPTLTSGFNVKIRFERAEDPNVIEYVAPDYGITEANPYRVKVTDARGEVTGVSLLEGKTPKGQLDGPAYIFANVFKRRGVRIVLEGISPTALAGGMESSNAFNIALYAAASMLSGANWSWADIFAESVKAENTVFGGLTGGQGHLASILGGAYRHVWLSGVRGSQAYFAESGNALLRWVGWLLSLVGIKQRDVLINPYGAFSMLLMAGDQVAKLGEHMVFFQAGKEYRDGKALVGRTAQEINEKWTDLLRSEDAEGRKIYDRQVELTAIYTEALTRGHMNTVVAAVNEYVDNRNAMLKRWKELGHSEVDEEAYWKGAKEIILEARTAGIAIMPLGAGGPGSNMIAISAKAGVLREFFERHGYQEINEDVARGIIRGTGVLKGYLPLTVSNEPVQVRGFQELGLTPPAMPMRVQYDESTGRFANVAQSMGDLPEFDPDRLDFSFYREQEEYGERDGSRERIEPGLGTAALDRVFDLIGRHREWRALGIRTAEDIAVLLNSVRKKGSDPWTSEQIAQVRRTATPIQLRVGTFNLQTVVFEALLQKYPDAFRTVREDTVEVAQSDELTAESVLARIPAGVKGARAKGRGVRPTEFGLRIARYDQLFDVEWVPERFVREAAEHVMEVAQAKEVSARQLRQGNIVYHPRRNRLLRVTGVWPTDDLIEFGPFGDEAGRGARERISAVAHVIRLTPNAEGEKPAVFAGASLGLEPKLIRFLEIHQDAFDQIPGAFAHPGEADALRQELVAAGMETLAVVERGLARKGILRGYDPAVNLKVVEMVVEIVTASGQDLAVLRKADQVMKRFPRNDKTRSQMAAHQKAVRRLKERAEAAESLGRRGAGMVPPDFLNRALLNALADQGLLPPRGRRRRQAIQAMAGVLRDIRGKEYSKDDVDRALRQAEIKLPPDGEVIQAAVRQAIVGSLNEAVRDLHSRPVLDVVDPSTLFSLEELALLSQRGDMLKYLYPLLSRKAKRVLLRPTFLLMFMNPAAKPGYILVPEANDPSPQDLASELKNIPAAWRTLGIHFLSPVAFSDYHLGREILRRRKMLQEYGVLTPADKGLLDRLQRIYDSIPIEDWAEDEGALLDTLLFQVVAPRIQDADSPQRDAVDGVMIGYPETDIRAYLEEEKAEREGRDSSVETEFLETLFQGVGLVGRPRTPAMRGDETDRYLSKMVTTLYHAYSLIRHHRDFRGPKGLARELELPQDVLTAEPPRIFPQTGKSLGGVAELENILEREVLRQQDTINLVPSMTHTPPHVLFPLIFPFHASAGERIRELAERRWLQVFAADEYGVIVDPHSGSQANQIADITVLRPGQKQMGMRLDRGGHLSHGHPLNVSGIFFDIVPHAEKEGAAHGYGVDVRTGRIDYDLLLAQALAARPKKIIVGATAYPALLDFERLAAIRDAVQEANRRDGVKNPEVILHADIAHIATQVSVGDHPSPFGHADIITLTNQKTQGPRGGLMFVRKRAYPGINRNAGLKGKAVRQTTLFELARKSTRPGIQEEPMWNVIAAKAAQAQWMLTQEYRNYAKRIGPLMRVFVEEGERRNIQFSMEGGSENHLALINTHKTYGLFGHDAELILETLGFDQLVGIGANRNTIPLDDDEEAKLPEKDQQRPLRPKGIRVGSPSMAARGFSGGEVKDVVGWIDLALRNSRVIRKKGEKPKVVLDTGLAGQIRAGIEALAKKRPVAGYAMFVEMLKGNLIPAWNSLVEHDPELAELAMQALQDQSERLTASAAASEMPLAVGRLAVHPASDIYAEGEPGRRYYPMNGVNDELELFARRAWESLFPGTEGYEASVQPTSHAQAVQIALMAAAQPKDRVVVLGTEPARYATHGHPLNFLSKFYRTETHVFKHPTGEVLRKVLQARLRQGQPRVILYDPAQVDPELLERVAREVLGDEVVLIADLGTSALRVAHGKQKSPFGHADLVIADTQSAGGFTGGIVFARKRVNEALNRRKKIAEEQVATTTLANLVHRRGVIPGVQGGPLLHMIGTKAAQALWLKGEEAGQIAEQLEKNREAFLARFREAAAEAPRFKAEAHPQGTWVTVKLPPGRTRQDAEEALLASAGIDVREPAFSVSSGERQIEIGLVALTMRGLKEEDMRLLADIVFRTLNLKARTRSFALAIIQLREEVRDLARKYPVHRELLSLSIPHRAASLGQKTPMERFEAELEAAAKEQEIPYDQNTLFTLFIGGEGARRAPSNWKYYHAFNQILKADMDAAGKKVVRVSYPVKDEADLARTVALIKQSPRVVGAVITNAPDIPLKIKTASLVDSLAGDSPAVGSINNITKTSEGALVGEAIDGVAFARGYEGELEGGWKGRTVTLMGATGGAGRQIAFALAQTGIAKLNIATRDILNGRDLRDALRKAYPRLSIVVTTYNATQFEHEIQGSSVVINATPVGEGPLAGQVPFEKVDELITDKHTVIDMVRAPKITALIERSYRRGARVFTGVRAAQFNSVLHVARWFKVLAGKDVDEAALFQGIRANDRSALGNFEAEEILRLRDKLAGLAELEYTEETGPVQEAVRWIRENAADPQVFKIVENQFVPAVRPEHARESGEPELVYFEEAAGLTDDGVLIPRVLDFLETRKAVIHPEVGERMYAFFRSPFKGGATIAVRVSRLVAMVRAGSVTLIRGLNAPAAAAREQETAAAPAAMLLGKIAELAEVIKIEKDSYSRDGVLVSVQLSKKAKFEELLDALAARRWIPAELVLDFAYPDHLGRVFQLRDNPTDRSLGFEPKQIVVFRLMPRVNRKAMAAEQKAIALSQQGNAFTVEIVEPAAEGAATQAVVEKQIAAPQDQQPGQTPTDAQAAPAKTRDQVWEEMRNAPVEAGQEFHNWRELPEDKFPRTGLGIKLEVGAFNFVIHKVPADILDESSVWETLLISSRPGQRTIYVSRLDTDFDQSPTSGRVEEVIHAFPFEGTHTFQALGLTFNIEGGRLLLPATDPNQFWLYAGHRASSLGTPTRDESFGRAPRAEDKVRFVLARQGRDYDDVAGTIEDAARVIGRERRGVFRHFYARWFGTPEAQAAMEQARAKTAEAHMEYVAGWENSPQVARRVYQATYDQKTGGLGVLATTSDRISQAMARQLEWIPGSFAAVIYTGPRDQSHYDAFYARLAKQLGSEALDHVIIERPGEGVSVGQALKDLLAGKSFAGKLLLKKVREQYRPDVTHSDLVRHTAVFAGEQELAAIRSHEAVKLVALGEKEISSLETDSLSLAPEQAAPAQLAGAAGASGQSPLDQAANIFGTTWAFLLARKRGDWHALLREIPDVKGHVIPSGDASNTFHLNPFGLSERVRELISEFQGFTAALRAA